MINRPSNIQVAELCPIQFTEPKEYGFYGMQQEYVGKIVSGGFHLQVLISSQVYASSDALTLRIISKSGTVAKTYTFTKHQLSVGHYYAVVKVDALSALRDELVYFELRWGTDGIQASSIWYLINPAYTADLKRIKYSHSDNTWGTVFFSGAASYDFWLDVEAGFIPRDNRDEQETEDFLEQNLMNETAYGEAYEVMPLTVGDSMGIPGWLRLKISRASLCDDFQVDGVGYKRISGAKMEKVEDCENGLATYKLDLQPTNNYLQAASVGVSYPILHDMFNSKIIINDCKIIA